MLNHGANSPRADHYSTDRLSDTTFVNGWRYKAFRSFEVHPEPFHIFETLYEVPDDGGYLGCDNRNLLKTSTRNCGR